jgi:hypothetical protein
MDAREAREHLEMVDRILSRAEPPKNYRPWSWALIILGTAAALMEAGSQFAVNGHGSAFSEAGAALMLAGYVYMIWAGYSSRRNAERVSAGETRIGKASSAVWLAVFIAFWAQPHIFGLWGVGAIWNLGGAIQMLMFGFWGNRNYLVGGLLLAISIPLANYVAQPGYALAAGFIVGYVIPGIMAVLEKSECDVSG